MVRLDKAVQTIVAERFGIDLPRSSINKLLQLGGVKYNGEVIKKKGFKFKDFAEARKIEVDEKIINAVIEAYTTGRVSIENAQMWDNYAPIGNFALREEFIDQVPDITDDILYQDKNFVFVYKPAGVLSHPAHDDQEDNMVYRFLKYFQAVSNHMPRGGLLHRLDRDTQGGMLFAQNLMAFNHVKSQFNTNQVIKLYLAVGVVSDSVTKLGKQLVGLAKKQDLTAFLDVFGQVVVKRDSKDTVHVINSKALFDYVLAQPKLDLDGYIAMKRFENKASFVLDMRKLKNKNYRKIKDARSEIYPLGYISDRGLVVFAVRLLTGRTHQIRAQAQFLGLPLLFDSLYSTNRLFREYKTKFKDNKNHSDDIKSADFPLHLASIGLSFYDLDKQRKYLALPKNKLDFRIFE